MPLLGGLQQKCDDLLSSPSSHARITTFLESPPTSPLPTWSINSIFFYERTHSKRRNAHKNIFKISNAFPARTQIISQIFRGSNRPRKPSLPPFTTLRPQTNKSNKPEMITVRWWSRFWGELSNFKNTNWQERFHIREKAARKTEPRTLGYEWCFI